MQAQETAGQTESAREEASDPTAGRTEGEEASGPTAGQTESEERR